MVSNGASCIIVVTTRIELSECIVFNKKKKNRKNKETIRDFATHQFGTLAMPLAYARAPSSFGRARIWLVSLYKG